MQYFQAVQEGKKRASRSQMRLFKTAGFAMLTLTTKKAGGAFAPVGEEDYAAMIQNQDGFIALLADGDGYTKAQTRATGREEAAAVVEKLARDGVPMYQGGTIRIWTEEHPVIGGP